MSRVVKLCTYVLASSWLLGLSFLGLANQIQAKEAVQANQGAGSGVADALQQGADNPAQLQPTLSISGIADTVMIFGMKYRGVRIQRIGGSELATGAGLATGDVLLSIDGRLVLSPDDIDKILAATASGDLELSFARQVNGAYRLIDNKVRFFNPGKPNFKAVTVLPVPSYLDSNQIALRIVELINTERVQPQARKPLTPLQLDTTLSTVANEHAQDMVKRNYFDHINPEGQGPAERLRKAGIGSPLAENILSGALTPEEAHDELMNEPINDPYNHRANILSPEFCFVGIGVARSKDGTLVVVETFAKTVPHAKVSSHAQP